MRPAARRLERLSAHLPLAISGAAKAAATEAVPSPGEPEEPAVLFRLNTPEAGASNVCALLIWMQHCNNSGHKKTGPDVVPVE